VASRVKVAVLGPGEAVEFLLHRTESDGDANAGQLAEELGFLPLAYGSTVPATFRLAFERIAEQAPAAMQLLSLCAFLAPELIPHWLVTASPGLLPAELAEAAADESIYTDTVGALHGLSLVKRDEHGLRVHRLVQAVARSELAADTEAAWATRAVQLLREVWPAEPEEPSTWPRCLELLPHVLIVTEHAEQLGVAAQSIAWLLHGCGGLATRTERTPRCGERCQSTRPPTGLSTPRSPGPSPISVGSSGNWATPRRRSGCDPVILVDETAQQIAAPDLSGADRHRIPPLVPHLGNGQRQPRCGRCWL
jgi:hypothetical protein